MASAQTGRRHGLPLARTILAGTVSLVAILWLWSSVATDDLSAREAALDWRSPLMSIVLGTGIVSAVAARTLRGWEPGRDDGHRHTALVAVVLGTALWIWLLFGTGTGAPGPWFHGVLAIGVGAMVGGTAMWNSPDSPRALLPMLVTSWGFAAAVCLKLTFWDAPRYTGGFCRGSMDCLGQPSDPVESVDFVVFGFVPLMVVFAGIQLTAWVCAMPFHRARARRRRE